MGYPIFGLGRLENVDSALCTFVGPLLEMGCGGNKCHREILSSACAELEFELPNTIGLGLGLGVALQITSKKVKEQTIV